MSDPIEAIIAKMTLEEKAALCTGASAWTTTPLEHLGVPELSVSDGPHGVRRVADVHAMTLDSLPATCFPTASCTASSWDVDLVHAMGQALAATGYITPGQGASIPTQPEAAVNAIRIFMGPVPVVMLLLAIIFAWKLKITRQSHHEMVEKLKAGK